MFSTLDELRQRTSMKWRYYPEDVLPAWVAEMDFTIAEPIARDLHGAIARSDIGYRDMTGLGEAFAGYADRAWGWHVDPRRVTAVADVVTGISQAMIQLTPPGSGIVINPPVYPPFFVSVRAIAEREVVEVPMLRQDDGHYRWDLAAMEAAFARPDVSGFLMCHPHNPTGSVATRAELAAIAELATRYDVAVISDEIHAPLTLPGAEHIPFAVIAGDDASVVTVTSASKSWNVPGLKCAIVVANARTGPAMSRMAMEATFGVGHLGVIAAITAFTEGEPWLAEVVSVLDSNRTLLAHLLDEQLPGVGYAVPAASYLAWLDFRGLELGEDPAAGILEHGRVALSSGPTYGQGGEGFARLNFGTSPQILREIVTRVAHAVDVMRA